MNTPQLPKIGSASVLPRAARRRLFRDAAVYDSAATCRRVLDGLDLDADTRRKFADEGLAYYRHELDRLDPNLVPPLYSVTWSEDIDTITVALGEESTSFIKQSFAGGGSQSATGKPWLNTNANTLPGVAVDGQLLTKPLRPCGVEISITEFEMARAQLTGRPIDTQKFDAMNARYQMGINEMVYLGDTGVGAKGLVNQADTQIATGNASNGAFSGNTPDEIIADINTAMKQCWENSGFTAAPTDVLLPPAQYAKIATTRLTDTAETIMSFLLKNSFSSIKNGQQVRFRSVKELVGVGASSTDRAVFYSRRRDFVRFPMLPIRRVKTYEQAIAFFASYIWVLGEVEFPVAESVLYLDAI